MDKKYLIREFEKKDDQAVLGLFKNDLLKTARVPAVTADDVINDENVVALVIENKDSSEIIGYGTVSVSLAGRLEGYVGSIQDIVIAKKYQHKGLGEELNSRLEQIAKNKKAHKNWLTSSDKRPDSIRFWTKKMGYTKRDTNYFEKELG